MKRILKYKYLILILILSALPYLFYADINSTYNNINLYSLSVFTDIRTNLHFGSYNYFLVPTDLIVYLLGQIVGNKLSIIIFHVFFTFIGGMGFFYIGKKIFKDDSIAFISSLFYIYGVYGQFVGFWHPTNILFGICPLLIYLLLSIKENSSISIYSMLLGLLSLFIVGVNLTFIIYLLFGILIYGLFIYFYISKSLGKRILIIYLYTLISSFFLTIFYYGTFWIQNFYDIKFLSGSLSLETVDWKSSTSWLYELFRELGSLNYYYKFSGEYSYPNAQYFLKNYGIIVFSYLAPIVLILSFIIKDKRIDKYLFLLLLSVLFLLFMSMGTFQYSPTRNIYKAISDSVFYFSIFRDSYKPMFFIHFIYSIFIGVFLYKIKIISFKKYYLLKLFILIIIFLLSYQFWSGKFLIHEQIKIPNYRNDFYLFHKDKKDSVVLLTPEIPFTVYDFTYQKGKFTNFYRPYFDNNVIYRQSGSVYDDEIIRKLYSYYKNDCFPKLLGFMGISGVLNQYDLDYKLYDARFNHESNSILISPEEIDQSLSNMSGLNYTNKRSKLSYYTVSSAFIYDDLYTPNNVIITGENLFNMCSKGFLKEKNAIAILDPLLISLNNYSFDTGNVNYINKINNSIYNVELNSLNKDVLFILNKRFDNGWKLFEVSEFNFLNYISLLINSSYLGNHIVANSFSNGWILGKDSYKKNKIIIVYMPQLYFYLFVTISGLTLFGFVLYILIIYLKNEHP